VSQDKAQSGPSVRNVALAPTTDFTGRSDELDKLRQLFDARLTGTVIVAIHGLGGVGKTQIALRYARTYASEYDVIWWLRSEQPATLASDFADLATELGLSGRGERDQRAAIEAVKRWLARNARWLLVFDSVRDPRDIEPYLVPGAPGQVLVTSRHASWVGIPRLHLRGLRRADSIELLLARSGVRDRTRTDQRAAADRLAEALGDLPLALAQAAAFMESHAHTIEQYLSLFREREQDLMSRGAASETAPTVATTWDISVRKVAEIAPAAAELLALCAFLAPDDIPREALRDGDSACPPELADALRDPIKLGDQIAALRRYSLIEAAGDDSLSVHRLVQAVVRERLSDDERRSWASRAAWLVNQIFPTDIDDPAVWPKCRRLLPHARAVAERAGAAAVADEAIAQLYHRSAKYSRLSGAFPDAHDLYLRALALATPLHGPTHPEVASLHRGLALTLVLGGIGDPKEALRLGKVALEIDESTFGPDDEVVARDHRCLMQICRVLGDRAAVGAHVEQVIRIYEKIYGPDDPRLMPLLNDRGFLAREDGKLDDARRLLERALSIGERTLRHDDPDIATFHSNLAGVLEELGELTAAQRHAEQALEIGERHYGPDHYVVAIRRNNLGVLLMSHGKRDLAGAKAQFERAVEIGRKVFAPGHRRLQKFEKNLAAVLAEIARTRA
jgi:tetratricopeptide (TPR) repeat protein